MKTMLQLRCPACNAELEFEEGREIAFCQYCGAKIIISDENVHTYRYVDEAELKKVEYENAMRIREFEFREKELNRTRRINKIWALSLVGASLLGLLMMIIDINFLKGAPVCGPIGLLIIWAVIIIAVIRNKRNNK